MNRKIFKIIPMKRLVTLVILSVIIFSCKKNTYSQAVSQNTDAQTQRIRLIMSSSLRSQGRSHWRQESTGQTVTDLQVAGAQVLAAQTLASSYILAAPTAINQLNGECIAFATNYMRSIEYYYATGAVSYSNSTNFFSPKYVYNQCKFGDCGSGTSAGSALTVMVQQGTCLYNTMPYDGNCTDQPNTTQRTEAANYKIPSYSQVFSGDLVAMKTLLANNHPFLLNTSLDDAVLNSNGQFAADGYIWSKYSGSGGLPHAMAIIGYDDTKVCPSNGAVGCFRGINSYGTGWGDSGQFWITYDWFVQSAGYYAYVINSGSTPPPANQPPIASVCCNQTVSAGATVNLDGSSSSDPDGTIASFAWAQSSGPNSATITNSTSSIAAASGLIAGTYVFTLTVTDNLGSTSTGQVTIVVASSESYTISGFKSTSKGAATDHVSWNIQLTAAPDSAYVQVSLTSSSSGFSTATSPLITVFPSGTYTYAIAKSNAKKTRYYRVYIRKSDHTTIVYTNVIGIR